MVYYKMQVPTAASSPYTLVGCSPLGESSPMTTSHRGRAPMTRISPVLPGAVTYALATMPRSSKVPSVLQWEVTHSFVRRLGATRATPRDYS